METIEIRAKKNSAMMIGRFALIGAAAMIVLVFKTKQFGQSFTIVFIGIVLFVLYKSYTTNKKTQRSDNKPNIVIAKNGFSYYEAERLVTLKWNDIQNVFVISDDEASYLILVTTNGERKVAVSWLDKSPGEIESLILDYKGIRL